jgi:hypothetical protein
MSDTADRTPKRPRLTTDGYEDVVPEECRDDDNAASINGMDLLDDDAEPPSPVGRGENSNRVDAPSGFDVNDNGDTDTIMSVRSFEEDAEELVEKLAEDVAIDTEAEAEGVAINAEAVDEIVDDGDDPNNQDFLLSRDEDEADTDMGDTRGNRRHWRNMVWDKEERKFVFETDGFNPVADNAMPTSLISGRRCILGI